MLSIGKGGPLLGLIGVIIQELVRGSSTFVVGCWLLFEFVLGFLVV